MRAVVVVNPTAGGGRARRLVPAVTHALDAASVSHRLVVTSDGAEPARIAEEAARGGDDAVVAVGGDGLVGACAAVLARTTAALTIVPGGTGNDLARALGLSRARPLEAIDALASGRRRLVDTVRVEGAGWSSRFSCVAGSGFDSETNAYANTLHRLRGTPRYVAAVFRTLARFRPATFTLRLDGHEERVHAMMVAVGNAPSYGGGMRVCPDARLDDGLLDVCVVGALPKLEFARTFPKVFRGTHTAHPAVRMFRARSVSLDADRPFEAYGDGELLGSLPVTYTVDASSLEVAAP